MLARKWRPKLFEEIAGQESIIKTIKNAIQYNQVAQAYLFSGPRGSGKTTLARLLAMAMNCINGPTITPCNQCSSCKEISISSSIDVIEIDGASNRGINEVRELRDIAQYRPNRDRYKIIIIDEVHMLTVEAFNALLKILEEPPAHVIFIFATTELRKVPNTIISRCQQFEFKRLGEKSIKDRLSYILQQEEISLTASAVSMLIKASEGSLRDALSMLDQLVSFAGKTITPDNIVALLGFLNIEHRIELAESILNGNAGKTLALLDDFYEKGYDPRTIYFDLCAHFRNLLIILASPAKRQHLNLDDNEALALTAQAEKNDLITVLRIMNMLLDSDFYMRQSDQPSIYLEMLLAKITHLKKLKSYEEAFNAIEHLESSTGTKSTAPQPGLFGRITQESEKKLKAAPVEINPFVKEKPAEPSFAAEDKKVPEPGPGSLPEANDPRTTVYKRIAEKKPVLASLLTSPEQLILEEKIIRVILPKNKELFRQDFEKGAYGEALLNIAQETLGKTFKIQVEISHELSVNLPQAPEQKSPAKTPPKKDNPADEKDPLALKAAELFKGTIKKD
jgi:DNA polymerase III subunit gamma/tau